MKGVLFKWSHYDLLIPYILIEDYLKNYNLNFVLIKKRPCLDVTQLGCQFILRGSLRINWKNIGPN